MRFHVAFIGLFTLLSSLLAPVASRAQEFGTYGNVRVSPGNFSNITPIYTPGTYSSMVAPNGAIYSIYTPGHPTYTNDNGPVYYVPAFRSYYQAPGSLHYYYGSYTPLNRSYANRR